MASRPDGQSQPRPQSRRLLGVLCAVALAWALAARQIAQLREPFWPALAVLAAGVLLGLLAEWLIRRRLGARLALWSRSQRVAGMSAALTGGVVVIASIPLPMPPAPWSPLSSLTVTALGEKPPEAHAAEVWLAGILTEHGDHISVRAFTAPDGWEWRGESVVSYFHQPATISWSGRIRGDAWLRLRSHAWCGVALISWNGVAQRVDLYDAGQKELSFPLRMGAHAPFECLELGLMFAAHAIALAGVFWVVATCLILRAAPVTAARRSWKSILVFAAPVAAVWSVCLLAYWPALMSSDSIDQWEQVLQGRFQDDHPALGTILLWAAAQVWPTPAVAGITQIAALSVLTGWGLCRLRELGCPRWLAWTTCAVMAASPVNAPLVVTLWKDVLYAIVMLWLSILVLLAVSQAERPRWWVYLAIGLAAALLAILRHNGIAPAVVTLALLLIAQRRRWRLPAVACVAFIAVLLGLKLGLYRALDVHPAQIQGWIYLPIHEIGAHVAAGTPIRDEERPTLRLLRDSDDWPYNPYYVNPLLYDGHFSYSRAQEHGRAALRLAFALACRAPGVSLHRAVCVSSLVWRLTTPPDSVYWTVLGARSGGEISAMYLPNRLHLEPAPLLPAAREKLADAITASMSPAVAWLFWRPALYLYLLLAATCVACARAGDGRFWLVAAPALTNSAVIALMTPAQDFRYQYGVYLVGIFLAPFLLWVAGRQSRTSTESLARASQIPMGNPSDLIS